MKIIKSKINYWCIFLIIIYFFFVFWEINSKFPFCRMKTKLILLLLIFLLFCNVFMVPNICSVGSFSTWSKICNFKFIDCARVRYGRFFQQTWSFWNADPRGRKTSGSNLNLVKISTTDCFSEASQNLDPFPYLNMLITFTYM